MKHKANKHPRQNILPQISQLKEEKIDNSVQTQLVGAVAVYRAAIEAAPAQPTDDAPFKVMQLLMARNSVAEILSKQISCDPAQLNAVIELDQQLKSRGASLTAAVGRQVFGNWRETIQPPAGYWWWRLDEQVLPKPSPVWTILGALFLAGAAALTTEIARRFFSNGADLAALPIPLAHATLTVLSGSLLTQTGQDWVERALLKGNIPRTRHPLIKTAFPLGVLMAGIGIYLLLPTFAKCYAQRYLHQNAYDLQETGKLDEAIKNYEKAISLDPDFIPAHYNLGDAYEISGDYEKAISEYQAALRLDLKSAFAPHAYNNLARLFLIRRNDPSTAIRLIDDALKQNPEDPLNRYTLYKNRAWAHFNLKCYSLAAADLCEALELNEEGAAAYCLMAQVLEAQSEQEQPASLGLCGAYRNSALGAWELCESYKSGQEREIEASWLSLAQERLRRETMK